jgi:hypothetical protein
MGSRGGLGVNLGTEDYLGDAVAVAQIDEDHPTMITAGGNPAAESNVASNIGGAQGAAEAVTVVHREKRCLAV